MTDFAAELAAKSEAQWAAADHPSHRKEKIWGIDNYLLSVLS